MVVSHLLQCKSGKHIRVSLQLDASTVLKFYDILLLLCQEVMQHIEFPISQDEICLTVVVKCDKLRPIVKRPVTDDCCSVSHI